MSGVHDLHVWSLKPGIPLLAAHLAIDPSVNPQKVLDDATELCNSMGINHTTLQLVGHDCPPIMPSPRRPSSQASPHPSHLHSAEHSGK